MTTEVQQAGERRVEVRHTTTADQFREALRGHAKVSPAARRQRWSVLVVGAFLVVMAVHTTDDSIVVDPVSVFLAVLFLLFGLVGIRSMTARAQQRIHEAHGERRITVDESGVTVETAHTLTRYGWPSMSRYVETRHLFVLVSADKRASCLVILPKRGTDGTDHAAPLRDLLGAHLPASG
ncbi:MULTISPECIES: YcxB family protein [unclassified Streptomyces]|uniref:YcxB family protein n=1 Tax=unclassified Streptomyces TaxID=2593676 RepID=UPI003D72A933